MAKRSSRCRSERVVKRQFIVVYSTFKKRLLARTFYLEEGYSGKDKYFFFTEVERQLAGCQYILTKRLYTVMGSQGYRVWKYTDDRGWTVNNAGTYQIYELYSNWTGDTYSYVENFNDWRPFLKKSIHKYSAFELIPEKEQHNNYMFKYLLSYDKHPQIEMLVKMGMFHLLEDTRYIRWKRKGVDMLGVSKQEVKYLQSGIMLRDYRNVRESTLKHHYSIGECKKAIECNDYGITDARAIRYMTSNSITAHDYSDYLGFLEQLGIPLQPKYLYPSDFKKAHDDRMKEVEAHKDEIIDKGIRIYAEELEKLCMKLKGLIIVPAKSQDELINESKVLEHCVRSYANKMSKKETSIFFIRNVNEIEKPFVTLELKNKKVVQCRTYHNHKPNDDVIDFVNYWCSKNKLQTCFN